MLSTNSLQAFSSASTTPVSGASRTTGPVRLARAPDQGSQAPQRQAATPAAPLPDTRPSLPPPRGSLLNLSV